jgi:5'-3' exonuclease
LTVSANLNTLLSTTDADLIMLGLVTHEPHFTLLREIVNFGFGSDSKNTLKTVMRFTKQSDFQLLHLSVLREYIDLEFCRGVPNIDLERTVDDFNFLTFLVGNDFLPHLNALDIGDGAFELIFAAYKAERHKWGEGVYLTHMGEICDPQHLEEFFSLLGATETEVLQKKEEDDVAYINKKRRWDRRDGKPEGPSNVELQAEEDAKQADYSSMIESVLARYNEEDFVSGWTHIDTPGEKDFKGRYYYEKLGLTPVDKKAHRALRKAYIEGLQWCLAYYYKGCISWGWFYPYHYGKYSVLWSMYLLFVFLQLLLS